MLRWGDDVDSDVSCCEMVGVDGDEEGEGRMEGRGEWKVGEGGGKGRSEWKVADCGL